MRSSLRLSALALAIPCALVGAPRQTSTDARQRDAASPADGIASNAGSPESSNLGLSDIEGVVGDSDGGPIDRARVCASTSTWTVASRKMVCVDTDRSGHYSMRGLAGGAYLLSATAEGFEVASLNSGAAVLLGSHRPSGSPLSFTLQPERANVEAIVVGGDGTPIPHATVTAERPPPSPVSIEQETDERGRLRLSLPRGRIMLSAVASGWTVAHWVGAAPDAGIRLQLAPEAIVRGVVVRSPGDEVAPNIEVRAVAPVGSTKFARFARTDTAGAFELRSLDSGPVVLTASGRGWRGVSRPIDLRAREVVDDLRIELSAAADVAGRVIFADGRPCSHGRISLGPPDPRQPAEDLGPIPSGPWRGTELTADIAPDGGVEFPAVPPGRYYTSVQCDTGVLKAGPRVLDVGGSNMSSLGWTVTDGARLSVRITDSRGRPLPLAHFVLQYPRWSGGAATPITTTAANEDGIYETERVLYPGVYQIRAAPPFEAEPIRVELHDAEVGSTAELRVMGDSSLTVLVQEAGAPVSELRVAAYLEASTGAASRHARAFPATPLGDGRYRVGPLMPGRYRLTVDDGVNPEVDGGTYELAGDEALQAKPVTLHRTGKLRGRMLDEVGSAVADALVTVAARSSSTRAFDMGAQRIPLGLSLPGLRLGARVLTDEKGRFVVDGLVHDAAYEVHAESDGRSATVSAQGADPEKSLLITLGTTHP